MSSPDNFAVFILTNGRPDNVLTYDTLRKSGYTGPIYLLVDDLDKTRERYIKNYGDEVIIFDKKAIAKTFDNGDNFYDMRAIIYARNASFEIAKKLGLKYFIQLDDDYTSFRYRFNDSFEYITNATIKKLDIIFCDLLEFYIKSGADSVAMAQGGDYIGGRGNFMGACVRIKRKCMNSFICSVERPFKFIGRVNEDVNTYTRLASTGNIFFTVNFVALEQKQTQSNPGGMTELYLDGGTYVKSFYSVMYQPSSVKVGQKASRLHHVIKWKNTVPMILREEVKKSVKPKDSVLKATDQGQTATLTARS